MKLFTLMRCVFIALIFSAFANTGYAAGWATASTVTQVEVVRGQGFMMFGSFGNANSCTKTTGVFVEIAHPQYDQLYAMALTAMMSGHRLKPHVNQCSSIGWHSGTYNTVTASDAMHILP